MQRLCLWVLWAQLPGGLTDGERAFSARLDGLCSFRDAAHMRRAMVEHRMISRAVDGSAYHRIEQRPPPEVRALIRLILKP